MMRWKIKHHQLLPLITSTVVTPWALNQLIATKENLDDLKLAVTEAAKVLDIMPAFWPK